ncbi:MAG: hypothetical protein AVDCRST_MAG02-1670, partial [uncultured Rubrobacteraceae bacterium]
EAFGAEKGDRGVAVGNVAGPHPEDSILLLAVGLVRKPEI